MCEAPSAATRAYLAWRRASADLALPAEYVAAHIRWGDKAAKETHERINASDYIVAARQLADEAGAPAARRSIFLATTSPRALVDARAALWADETIFASNASHVPDELTGAQTNYWLSKAAKREVNFLEAFADVWTILGSRGAVLTLSSNMARWVWFHNQPEIRSGRQQIKLLDSFGAQAVHLGKYPPQPCNY